MLFAYLHYPGPIFRRRHQHTGGCFYRFGKESTYLILSLFNNSLVQSLGANNTTAGICLAKGTTIAVNTRYVAETGNLWLKVLMRKSWIRAGALRPVSSAVVRVLQGDYLVFIKTPFPPIPADYLEGGLISVGAAIGEHKTVES